MKKIFTLAAILAVSFAFAQEGEKTETTATQVDNKHQISANFQYSDPSQIGLQYEYKKPLKDGKHATSHVVNLGYGLMDYEVGGNSTNGQGFVVELGGRTYFGPVHKGVYYANYLSYGNIKFDEQGEDGTYSYFSFFAPELGYKIQMGGFSIDPFIGGMWKLEIKGKGGIDNKNVEEWAFRAGVKVGYSF
ncbi:MAG: hypothetical protein ACO1N9_12220 [Flavobacterium sp.]